MRTTLVSGVLTYYEVETSPRHHEQRRAHPVYPLGRGVVKRILAGRLFLRNDGIEQLAQRAQAGDGVLLHRSALLVALSALVAQA